MKDDTQAFVFGNWVVPLTDVGKMGIKRGNKKFFFLFFLFWSMSFCKILKYD